MKAPVQAQRPGLAQAASGAAFCRGLEMWRRLASPFKAFGPLAGFLYLTDRLLRALSPRLGLCVYELMVQPIGAAPLLTPSLARHLSHRLIQPGDPELGEMPALPEIKAARFEQGASCLGVFLKGHLVGYIWLCRQRYLEDEVRCTYVLDRPADSVFDFDLVVLPAYRLGIGFAAVWDAANAYLTAQGVRYSFSRITRFNLVSRRSHARLGARRAAAAVFLKAWGLELMVATLAPFVALTTSTRAQRTRLRLKPDVLRVERSSPAGATEKATFCR